MLQQLLLDLATHVRDLLSWHKVSDLQFIINDPEVTGECHGLGVQWLWLDEGMTMGGSECLCISLHINGRRVHLSLMLLCWSRGGGALQCLD